MHLQTVARRKKRFAGPLASWSEGSTKRALFEFVRSVTTRGSVDFVPAPDRIAAFDDDGTLWVDSPLCVQAYFLLDRVTERIKHDRALAADPDVVSLLDRDLGALQAMDRRRIVELVTRVHAGLTTEELEEIARDWLTSATHPHLGRPFTQCVYQPMRELMDHLRTSGFTLYVATGAGVEFVRAVSETLYRVPKANVIGSWSKTRFVERDGRAVLETLPEVESFDDREAKASNIALHVGRRPILACGSSDGDLAMLRYAQGGPGRRMMLLLHHDDGERELPYDRSSRTDRLGEGLDEACARGWTVVSVKHDFASVFPSSR